MTDKQYNVAIERLTMPAHIKRLRVSSNGFPVPKFVQDVDGKPDFRVVNSAFMASAVRLRLCWICGEPLGANLAFVAGPMCCATRTVSEPPCSLTCARFAAIACPFLTQPRRPRNVHGLPDEAEQAAGIAIDRNPGCCAVWICKDYKSFRAPAGKDGKSRQGVLFKMGEPTAVEWYARGRAATRDEVMESIRTGLPLLENIARQDGPDSMRALDKQVEQVMTLLPA